MKYQQGNNQNNQHGNNQENRKSDQIEPNAGKWRTWVISSGKDFSRLRRLRISETRAELKLLADLITQRRANQTAIKFWDAGPLPIAGSI